MSTPSAVRPGRYIMPQISSYRSPTSLAYSGSPPKSYDFANLKLDAVERLRQLELFGMEENSGIGRYQEAILAAAKSRVNPAHLPYLQSIEDARPPLADEPDGLNNLTVPDGASQDIEMGAWNNNPPNSSAPGTNNQSDLCNMFNSSNWLPDSTPQADTTQGLWQTQTASTPLSGLVDHTSSSSHSSTSQGSHNLTSFSGLPTSDHSYLHTNSSAHAAIQRPRGVPPMVQAIINKCLVGIWKIRLSPAELQELIHNPSKSTRWTNREKVLLLQALYGVLRLFGPESTVHIDTPFGLKTSPKLPEWDMVGLFAGFGKPKTHLHAEISTLVFDNGRGPSPLACQYSELLKTYCQIVIMFDVNHETPLPLLLERMYGTILATGGNDVPGMAVSTKDLMAFIDGGEDSWFALMHNELNGNPIIAERIASLCNSTVRSKPKSTFSSSIQSSLVPRLRPRTTAPLPVVAQHVDWSQASASQTGNEGPGVDASIPTVGDMIRDNQASNMTRMELARSKSHYLTAVTQHLRMDLVARISKERRAAYKEKYKECLELMKDPQADEDLRNDAKRFMQSYIQNDIPNVNFAAILREFRYDLPGLNDIANVFYNAPELGPKSYQPNPDEPSSSSGAANPYAGPVTGWSTVGYLELKQCKIIK
ncbi:hypothetical protein RhiJN_24286 [Ceratobasidium sp. AG-Ba]|nr:hypothetical protein RhiJN_24286 [Ceratobasidium sp. AG-Ba]